MRKVSSLHCSFIAGLTLNVGPYSGPIYIFIALCSQSHSKLFWHTNIGSLCKLLVSFCAFAFWNKSLYLLPNLFITFTIWSFDKIKIIGQILGLVGKEDKKGLWNAVLTCLMHSKRILKNENWLKMSTNSLLPKTNKNHDEQVFQSLEYKNYQSFHLIYIMSYVIWYIMRLPLKICQKCPKGT